MILIRGPGRAVLTDAFPSRSGGGRERGHRPEGHDARLGVPRRVVKGGSFLCADSYCMRYRPAARRPQAVDTGMSHIGFRCVALR